MTNTRQNPSILTEIYSCLVSTGYVIIALHLLRLGGLVFQAVELTKSNGGSLQHDPP